MNHPTATRATLFRIAGLLWIAVGLGMFIVSLIWFDFTNENAIYHAIVAIIFGSSISKFMFEPMVVKNIDRLYSLSPEKEKVCAFAFQNTRSYLIALVMMAMGYTLRHLPIDKAILAPIYLCMGLALLLASLKYFGHKPKLQ